MLEALLKELEGIKLDDPEVVKLGKNLSDLKEGDELIGTLDEQSVRLNVLIMRMRQQSMRMMMEHAMAHLNDEQHDDEACKAFKAQFVEHSIKTKILDDMLWGIIRMDHSLINAESIGVRRGWQVVKSKPELRKDMGGAMIEVLTMSGPEDMAELLSTLGGHKHGHGGCSGCGSSH